MNGSNVVAVERRDFDTVVFCECDQSMIRAIFGRERASCTSAEVALTALLELESSNKEPRAVKTAALR